MLKRMVAWSPSGQVIAERETILSEGNFYATDIMQEDLAVSYFDLTLGECGKEQPWVIDDVIEVDVSTHSASSRNQLTDSIGTVSDPSFGTQPRKWINLCSDI